MYTNGNCFYFSSMKHGKISKKTNVLRLIEINKLNKKTVDQIVFQLKRTVSYA